MLAMAFFCERVEYLQPPPARTIVRAGISGFRSMPAPATITLVVVLKTQLGEAPANAVTLFHVDPEGVEKRYCALDVNANGRERQAWIDLLLPMDFPPCPHRFDVRLRETTLCSLDFVVAP